MNLKKAAIRFKHQILLKMRRSNSLSLSSTGMLRKRQVESNDVVEGHALIDQAFLHGGLEEEEEDDDDDDRDVYENESEMLRRKRIGLANKGKIPWNKGITHNEVTRQKIKQRTIEALRNPKVRKKMSECYRDRSDQCKEKISASLRHVWAKRLNYPRQREEFYMSWFESIAVAAKEGGKDQKELEWDSYDKITEELFRQKQQRVMHDVKSKVKAMLAAKRNTPGQSESRDVIEDQPKKKVRRKKLMRGNSEEIVVADESNLLARLSKIKRPAAVTIKAEPHSSQAWEKLDLEYFKRENRQKVSLADQIRAAKKRREKLMSLENCSPSTD